MAKSKLIENIISYFNTVPSEIKKIPMKDKDALRGISYTAEQVEESKKEKENFLKRFADFVPKAEKILSENKKDFEKQYEEWKKTEAPPKTTAKAQAILYGAIISSIIAALIPIFAAILTTFGYAAATWIGAASIPEIFGGSYLLNKYDVMKANINKDYLNWKEKGDSILEKIQTVDRTIDTLYILKYRIEFYVNDDNIMANEWTFQSIKKEAEMLMESVLNV